MKRSIPPQETTPPDDTRKRKRQRIAPPITALLASPPDQTTLQHGEPIDVVLHVQRCAFGLHTTQLQKYWPWFYKQLVRLRYDNGTTKKKNKNKRTLMKLVEVVDLLPSPSLASSRSAISQECLLGQIKQQQGLQRDTLVMKCWTHSLKHEGRKQRYRKPEQSSVLHVEFSPQVEGVTVASVATLINYHIHTSHRLSIEENTILSPTTMNGSILDQVLQLCQSLQLENELVYTCLQERITHGSTIENWVDLLLLSESLREEPQRRRFLDQVLHLIRNCSSEIQHAILGEAFKLHRLAEMRHRESLVRVVLFFINHVRNFGIWQRLVDVMERWILRHTKRHYNVEAEKDLPLVSLIDLHKQFAPWDPFLVLPTIELTEHHSNDSSNSESSSSYHRPSTLFTFGAFEFQIRMDSHSLTLMHWRVVKRSNATSDTKFDEKKDPCDPAFTVRGQLHIRYKCADKGPVAEELVPIRYTHTRTNYAKWHELLLSSSENATLYHGQWDSQIETETQYLNSNSEKTENNNHQQGMTTELTRHNDIKKEDDPDSSSGSSLEIFGSSSTLTARFTGRFFLWGHRICTLYHYLLVSTLFYSTRMDTADAEVVAKAVHEMERLPLETLMMVLQSDRLRVRGGETSLVQALMQLCFGKKENQPPLLTDGSSQKQRKQRQISLIQPSRRMLTVEDIRALFACVRWGYADLNQIMMALETSPRECLLFEIIERILSEPASYQLPRRRPWHARQLSYEITTTLIEFQIEAGDRALSPGAFRSPALPPRVTSPRMNQHRLQLIR